jgi:hypothetical protein
MSTAPRDESRSSSEGTTGSLLLARSDCGRLVANPAGATCAHCRYSQWANPFGLWCLLRDEAARRVCECWERAPGAEG